MSDSGLPEPKISQALLSDPCDVTDANHVRLNPRSCNSCKDHDPAWHARHVFGHWLCDLHGSESYETPTRPGFEGISDAVADYLANTISTENREKTEETVPASNLDTES